MTIDYPLGMKNLFWKKKNETEKKQTKKQTTILINTLKINEINIYKLFALWPLICMIQNSK